MNESRRKLPGQDLVTKGLQDLSQGVSSVEALLVLIGAPRLRRMGISIPVPKRLPDSPERALYFQLQNEDPRDVHSRYNALIRRLVSYERTLEKK
jgi:hypothetical protein